MKGKKLILLTSALCVLTGGSVMAAADYTSMSNEDLSKIRGTLQTATETERQSFRSEWQKRIGEMSPEDRQKYMGKPKGAKQMGRKQAGARQADGRQGGGKGRRMANNGQNGKGRMYRGGQGGNR